MPRTMPSSTGLPVHLGVQQLAQQVVAGVLLALGQLVDEVVEQALAPAWRRSWSSANSRTSRTHPVKVSARSVETPRMRAITRTGICWA